MLTLHVFTETVKAKVDYQGQPSRGGGSRPLMFRQGAKIDVIEKSGDWWKVGHVTFKKQLK